MEKRLFKMKEAMEYLGISRYMIRKLERSGVLPAIHVGKEAYFTKEILEEFLCGPSN